jgi:hypothetical protein
VEAAALGAAHRALTTAASPILRHPVQYVSLVLLVGMTTQDPRVLLRMLTGVDLVALLDLPLRRLDGARADLADGVTRDTRRAWRDRGLRRPQEGDCGCS